MIPFVRDLEFQYGCHDSLTPRIGRVIANNPGPLTFTGTGTYIVGGANPDADLAVIDPGPMDEDHLSALFAAVQGRKVSHILITHTHRDHSPLAHRLAEATGASILTARPPAIVSPDSATTDEEQHDPFRPDVILTDGDRLVGDGWTLEAVFTPGHASNHMAFALLEENALFCGDHVMGWSTTVVAPPDGNMADYMASLDKVIARRFDTLWPTHGAPIRDPAPFLEAYRDHRFQREAQILTALKAGNSRIADIVASLYAQIAQTLWPAASLSVQAHLIKLVDEGRVVADHAPTLDATYRLV